jgi:hypothetical protein
MSAIRLCEDTGRQLLTALLTGQRRSFCLEAAASLRLVSAAAAAAVPAAAALSPCPSRGWHIARTGSTGARYDLATVAA